MPAPRSLPWRLLPWLFPLGLIVIGLIFVTASLTGTDEPDNIVAPPNVRAVTTRNASAWALRQVQPGITSEVTGVVMVSSRSTGATTYAIRAVIGRVDAPAAADATTGGPGDEVRTVVTCVAWDVDVNTGRITEHGADQLTNRVGRHALGDSDTLRSQCTAATFAG